MSEPQSKPRRRWRWLAGAVLLAVVAGGVFLWAPWTAEEADSAQPTVTVRRGPLTININETGSITNRDKIILKSEVPGTVSILSLIDEGTRVAQGDLLIELDSSDLKDQRDQQQITVLNSEASLIQARENLAVQKNEAQAQIEKAQFERTVARSDLKKYTEGDYPQDLAQAQAQITLAREDLQRASEKLTWSKRLAGEGYITGTELDADEAAVNRAKLDLELAEGRLTLLKEHTYTRRMLELDSAIRQAELALERVKRKARADVVQAEASLQARQSEHTRKQEQLATINERIANCRITAPQDGVVVYATTGQWSWRGNTEPLAKGQEVRHRQELLYLPTDDTVMAEIKIHESVLRKVEIGQPARITVDAMPGEVFHGQVGRISLYPDGMSVFMNPDLKVYSTDVYIDQGDVSKLRAGMGCRVEIIVEELPDAMYLAVQCVVRLEGKPVVYIPGPDDPVPVAVTIGLDNGRMIHIKSGLIEGQEVLLAPPLKTDDATGQPDMPRPATRPSPAGRPEEQSEGRSKGERRNGPR
jgi:HlyD family secretion protein